MIRTHNSNGTIAEKQFFENTPTNLQSYKLCQKSFIMLWNSQKTEKPNVKPGRLFDLSYQTNKIVNL